MNEYEDRARQYRQRAEELRAILPDMHDQVCRDTLIKIAAGYDKLADEQDQFGKESRAHSAIVDFQPRDAPRLTGRH
jgi:cation transport regulator ChaB